MSKTDDNWKPRIPDEPEFGGSTRLFQIREPDLAELERMIPALCEQFMEHLTPRSRAQFRRAKQILSNVRWHDGPPEQVERIDS